jgi:hypothetical protein
MATLVKPSYTLVDNWMLELAIRMLNDDFEGSFSDKWETFYHSMGGSSRYLREGWTWETEIVKEITASLLQFLDLLVLNDELVYESEYSFAWKRFRISNQIEPLLREVRLSRHAMRELILSTGNFPPTHDSRSEVSRGAIHYLALSRFLGVYYWPSPKRAEYLQQHLHTIQGGFVLGFREYLDESLAQIATEILDPIKMLPSLYFSGFATTVLASCDKPSSIMPTLIQVR